MLRLIITIHECVCCDKVTPCIENILYQNMMNSHLMTNYYLSHLFHAIQQF